MKSERIRTPRVLPVGVTLLVLSVVGCTEVGPVHNPSQFMTDRPATHIWVKGSDNQLVELTHARVANDTLSGFSNSKYYEVPMADVKELRAKQPAPGHTLLAVGVGVASAGLIVAALASNKPGACGTWVGQTLCYPGGPICSQGVWTPCAPSTSRNEP